MKNNEINTIIENYIREKLSPQPDEREFITNNFEELCSFLKELEEAVFKNGSWARFTAIHPVSDLDAIWPLPAYLLPPFTFAEVAKGKIDPNRLDISNILKDLAKKLAEQYRLAGKSVIVEAQSHSVGIFFSPDQLGFSIDLVPAIPTGEKNENGDNMYYVPEILKMSRKKRELRYKAEIQKNETIKWIKTDPRGYISDSQKVNELNPSYRKSAKFTKKWNFGCKENTENHILKSFHIELITREVLLADITKNTYDTIVNIFSNLEKYLSSPLFPDRADPQRYVDSYITEITDEQRAIVIKHISKAIILLRSLENAQNESEIRSILDEILKGGASAPNFYIKPAQREVKPSGAWSM